MSAVNDRCAPIRMLMYNIYLHYHTCELMARPLRIAILECDTPIGQTKAKYGGYGNLFKELLLNGADKLAQDDSITKPELDITKFDVVSGEQYPKLDEIDAVLLTGSSMPSNL